jgi:antagonist of KipI
MIEILRAPAHLVLQDFGFVGYRKIGLPRSGAMDPHSLSLGNSLVGNSAGEVGFEWALGGGTVRFNADVSIAFTGAVVHGRLGQGAVAMNRAMRVKAGTTLEIDRFSSGRFVYMCVSPAPAITPTFGSKSTYSPAGIGGFEGRRLKTGDKIPLTGTTNAIQTPEVVELDRKRSTFRVVPGPQATALDGKLLEFILRSEFEISRNSDRTGYRLEGPRVEVTGLGQILSEPACEGSIQITDSGMPIVLMADGPTIGGYNKVAVVTLEDLGLFAQRTPGERVHFALKKA